MGAAYYTLRRASPVVEKVQLVHPIMVNNEEVAELWLTRPKLGMLRGVNIAKIIGALQAMAGAKGTEADKDAIDLVAMIAAMPDDVVDTVRDLLPALAAIKPEEADAIDYTDFWSLWPVILGFFGDFPTAGSA